MENENQIPEDLTPEEYQKGALSRYLTAQRSFLLAMPLLFEKVDQPEFWKTINPRDMFQKCWEEAWACNEAIAKLLEVTPEDAPTIQENANSTAILKTEQEKGDDLEYLANL